MTHNRFAKVIPLKSLLISDSFSLILACTTKANVGPGDKVSKRVIAKNLVQE